MEMLQFQKTSESHHLQIQILEIPLYFLALASGLEDEEESSLCAGAAKPALGHTPFPGCGKCFHNTARLLLAGG